MFALVDCNNFYASCERVFKPQLNNQPVAILSNNDGCVISRSDEARAIGLPMGAPAFKYKDFFEQNNIHVFSSNYPLYGDMSKRVMDILKQFTPDVEIYSIDEAFLQLKIPANDYYAHGKEIKYRIEKWTGIPISIGIAPTKGLSKVANKIARKFKKRTGGVYVIDSEEKRIKSLKWTKIDDVWGIGRNHAERLRLKNIRTALDFTQLSDPWVRKHMAVIGLRLKKDLEGSPTLQLSDGIDGHRKAIATTRSFDYSYSDYQYIKERIATFAASCAEKLRKQNDCCTAIIVMLRSDFHKKEHKQHKGNIYITLPYTTDSTLTITSHAIKGLASIYKKDIQYKRAGVIVTGLIPANAKQLDLFHHEDAKHHEIMKVMDNLNKKYGSHKLKIANQDLNKTWKMRQEHLSPRYTTNINDIIEVKCN